MALTKQKKQEVSTKIVKALNEANSVVFVHAKGISVADTQAMREKLKEEGVSYYVAKKSLVKRALSEHTYAGTQPVFEGELAIAWGADLIAPAREVQTFAKPSKDKMSIVGGIFEGRYMSAVEMNEIASIPSQHTLYAQIVNIINSPIQQFVVALDQIAQAKTSK
ncbi:MAG: 50S ribosomal protein L10 [Candidatus Pacebacteria bacterium]|nr:50S ribosomal protein L10 [Candidatus Paceibacterota bacterium]